MLYDPDAKEIRRRNAKDVVQEFFKLFPVDRDVVKEELGAQCLATPSSVVA